MAIEDWDKNPGSGLAVKPLLRWETASIPTAALVRLVYLLGPQTDVEREAVQLAMTPLQARLLAADLLKMAAAIEGQEPGTRQ